MEPEFGFRNDLHCKFDRLKFFLGKYGLLYIPLFLSAGSGDEWCMLWAYLKCPNCPKGFWEAQNQNCIMTATGSSIVALMAVTSLLLPFTSRAHWVTRALWVVSMLSAFISVLFVCQKQRFIGRVLFYETMFKGQPCEVAKFRKRMRECHPLGGPVMPRLPLVLLLCAPKTFLDYAIAAYVLGLGVYLGFVWQNSLDVDAGHDDSRNIFIVFLIFTCFYFCILHLMPDPNLKEWSDFRIEWDKYQEIVNQTGCERVKETKVVAPVSEEGYCGAG